MNNVEIPEAESVISVMLTGYSIIKENLDRDWPDLKSVKHGSYHIILRPNLYKDDNLCDYYKLQFNTITGNYNMSIVIFEIL